MSPDHDVIGVGLVGAGAFGRRLASRLPSVPGLRLAALHDADAATAAAASAELGVPASDSVSALVGRMDVAAVIIATPHASHAPIALEAAAAGRHLFVEKPLAVTTADARRIADAARSAGVALVVGHVTRLLPVPGRVFELLDDGIVGTPLAAWMIRHQPLTRRGWMSRRSDFGMVLHSPAVHNVDLLLRVLGPARTVSALAAPSIQAIEYPDIVSVLVAHEGGGVGSLGATVSDPLFAPTGTSSARIVGSEGGLAFDVATGRIHHQRVDDDLIEERIDVKGWGLDDAVTMELTSWRDAIRGDAEPFVAPIDAIRAVALCEAADRSIEAAGAPIAVADLPGMGGRS
ncbi:MAG: Gfo/Idh/MocA family oxidoreductase [Chloroflexota bacterium]